MQIGDHYDDFAARIIRIVAAQDDRIDAGGVTLETNLKEDLKFDSLAALTLMFALEEAFRINISDDDARDLKTVGDIVARLRALRGEAPQTLRVLS
jgi:acyl carrier protein